MEGENERKSGGDAGVWDDGAIVTDEQARQMIAGYAAARMREKVAEEGVCSAEINRSRLACAAEFAVCGAALRSCLDYCSDEKERECVEVASAVAEGAVSALSDGQGCGEEAQRIKGRTPAETVKACIPRLLSAALSLADGRGADVKIAAKATAAAASLIYMFI